MMRGWTFGRLLGAVFLLVAVTDVLVYIRRRQNADVECCHPDQHSRDALYPIYMGVNRSLTYKTVNLNCNPGVPCEYPEEVDFRIIVITCNRSASLATLLKSVEKLEMDGDIGILEIWIDISKTGQVDKNTLRVADNFDWSGGVTRVQVQKVHAGIYGQWIDTWRPLPNSKEIALILEDDLSISPYIYRWLKAAHAHYGSRPDVAGYSLQSEQVNVAKGAKVPLKTPRNQIAYLYKLVGSWGFSPHPKSWALFQDWYHKVSQNKEFHPYVPDLTMTKWYKSFEKTGAQDSMWTMWYIYFCEKNGLYTVYNNIAKVAKQPRGFLAQHRREPGLHFHGASGVAARNLLQDWRDKYIRFPIDTMKYGFDGRLVNKK